ncbi:kinase-like protein [Artomyces pyxidatus]|uniref:Kinase-like protein n=1 Tax=Artomyces pyxidatus TaxID=48021 RepID=A0ACB8SKN7_9AGAM|nr:kinase-like protein [Artomyces pyxidatus]
MDFPEENLLATADDREGFFITALGDLLKDGRYKVLRKLGRGRCSNTFLVEDLKSTSPSREYLAAKILSADATNALRRGVMDELGFLQTVKDTSTSGREPRLPILHDHFAQQGYHGVHYCFLTRPQALDVHAFRASAPTGKLAAYIVKRIMACVVEGLKVLHSLDIIHADMKADNVLCCGPSMAEIEETLKNEPVFIYGDFEVWGRQYPIFRSQPLQADFAWNTSPSDSERIAVVLSDFDSCLWADEPKPEIIAPFALRAPENIVRAECGKEIDIWAIGCMTYELLTGQFLLQPQPIDGLSIFQRLLLLQCCRTVVSAQRPHSEPNHGGCSIHRGLFATQSRGSDDC